MDLPVWPYPPQRDILEIIEWGTDVIRSRSGKETRGSYRQNPTRKFEAKYDLTDRVRAYAENQLHQVQGTEFLYPVWCDYGMTQEDVSSGSTTLKIPLERLYQYSVGEYALVYRGPFDYAAYQVTDISEGPGTLTLANGVESDVPSGTHVTPAHTAYIDGTINVNRLNDHTSRFDVPAILKNGWTVNNPLFESLSWDESFNGIDYLGVPNRIDDLSDEINRQKNTISTSGGNIVEIDKTGYSDRVYNHRFVIHDPGSGSEAKETTRKFLRRRQGQQESFLARTRLPDIEIVSTIAANDEQIEIENIGYQKYSPKKTRSINKDWYHETTLTESGNNTSDVEFSSDGQWVAYAGVTGAGYGVIVHDVGGSWSLETTLNETSTFVRSVAFSSNNDWIAYSDIDGNVYIHQVGGTWSLETTLTEATDDVNSVDFSPDNQWIAYASGDDNLYVHNVGGSWGLETTLSGNTLQSVAFSPDSQWIAYGGYDDEVSIHNVGGSWSLETTLTESSNIIWSIAFSPENDWVAYGVNNSRVYIHEIGGTWTLETNLKETTDDVNSVAFSPDNQWIAYGGYNNEVSIHDVGGSWSLETTLTESKDTVWAIAFSPNDEWIVYGNGNNNVYVHDIHKVLEYIGTIFIEANDGSNYKRNVLNTSVENGEEILQMEESLDKEYSPSDIERAEFIQRCRLDSDRVEIRWRDRDRGELTVPVRVIEQ